MCDLLGKHECCLRNLSSKRQSLFEICAKIPPDLVRVYLVSTGHSRVLLLTVGGKNRIDRGFQGGPSDKEPACQCSR